MAAGDGETKTDSVAYQLGHLNATVVQFGHRLQELTEAMANQHQELVAMRSKIDAISPLERRATTRSRRSDRKPWELPIGELAATIGIQALKVVGVAGCVALLMWALTNAKLP